MEEHLVSTQLAIGLRMQVGEHLCDESNMDEFLTEAACSIEPPLEEVSPDNVLTAKYYDYYTGEIFFHFSAPIDAKILEPYFEYSQIIPYIFEN